ncbi:anti-sigma factor [Candidatus Poriferisodalis sp.]|uniref:anti-sigma factor n=1 Tax=Candidatus Poriferisodalis sp. TaxID=3101277 RepID=UPI003B01BF98
MADRPDRRDAEMSDTADLEATLRELDADSLELLTPPPEVWQGIESTLAAQGEHVGTATDRSGIGHEDGRGPLNNPDSDYPNGHSDDPGADRRVVPLDSRRRWKRVVLPAAAAVALLAVGVTSYVVTRADPDRIVAGTTLAYDAAAFDPLGAQARADAQLFETNGRYRVLLVNAVLPAAGVGADLEAWLIQPDGDGNVADLVSLGLVDASGQRSDGVLHSFAVPAAYDPAVYSVVDISVEERDGNPAHSGRSILRGVLKDG